METKDRIFDAWKQRVAASFSKASRQYAAAASVQKNTAAFLADQIANHLPQQTDILELGAGTGFLTRHLLKLFDHASIRAIDLSPSMLEELSKGLSCKEKKRVELIIEDMDLLQQTKSYSLICSSFSLQWSIDPLALLTQSAQLLKQGGFLAHAMPIKGSLRSLASQGYLQPIPQLSISMDQWMQAALPLDIVFTKRFEIRQEFDSPLKALQSIKSFGGCKGSSLRKSLFSLKNNQDPIQCEWRIGCLIARKT